MQGGRTGWWADEDDGGVVGLIDFLITGGGVPSYPVFALWVPVGESFSKQERHGACSVSVCLLEIIKSHVMKSIPSKSYRSTESC